MTSYIDHYKGERKQDRRTPRDFFLMLHEEYDFTLDGAATAENALLLKFSTETNPLSWRGERVFCNPPWGNIPPFIDLASKADFACLLVPARVNAKWFHRALLYRAKVRYFQGKLKFDGPWNSPVDCLLLIFSEPRQEVHCCSNCGSPNHIHCTREKDMPAAKAIVEAVEKVISER